MHIYSEYDAAKRLRQVFLDRFEQNSRSTTVARLRCIALKDLGDHPKLDQVKALVAKYFEVPRLYEPKCDQCGGVFAEVVVMDQLTDRDDTAYKLCPKCLITALQMLEGD